MKKDKINNDLLFSKFKEMMEEGNISSFTYYCRYVDAPKVICRTITQEVTVLGKTYNKDNELEFIVNEREFNRYLFEKTRNNEVFSNNFYHDTDECKIHYYVKNGARVNGKEIQVCEFGTWRTVPAEKSTYLI